MFEDIFMKGLKAANLKKAKFKFPGGSSPCNITGEKPILVPRPPPDRRL